MQFFIDPTVHRLVGEFAWHFLASDFLNEFADSIRDLLVHATVFLHGIRACETRTSELLLDGLETLVKVVTVISTTGVAGVVVVIHDEEGEACDNVKAGVVDDTTVLGFETVTINPLR